MHTPRTAYRPRRSRWRGPMSTAPDRTMMLDVHGTVDGIEVMGTICIRFIRGAAYWFVNGEPAYYSSNPILVGRNARLLDRLRGLPVEPEHAIEDAFDKSDPFRREPNALQLAE